MPAGTIVGIDHRSFIAGPNFKGVKMIPAGGVHFVATNASGRRKDEASSSSPSSSSHIGPTNFFFFHASEPGAVIVRRWSVEHEVLVPLNDEDEEARYAAGVRNFDFDAGLAPYDLGSLALWRSLTRFISQKTTARVAPPGSSGIVAMSVVAEAEEVERRRRRRRRGRRGRGRKREGEGKGEESEEESKALTEAERKLDEQLERGRRENPSLAAAAAPDVVPDVVGAPRYVELPRHAIVSAGGGGGRGGSRSGGGEKQSLPPPPLRSSSSLLTAANMDKTSTLQAVVLNRPFDGDVRELLGELQHSFVSFWAGHSLLAFGAWRDAVALALSCEAGPCLVSQEIEKGESEERALRSVCGAFFRAFVDALAAQLEVATMMTPNSSSSVSAHSSSSSAAANAISIVDDLLEDSFLRKTTRQFLERVREASEEGGVDFFFDGEKGGEKIRLPPPSQELLDSCARLSRVLERGLGWVGLGKARMKELRISDESGGGGRRTRRERGKSDDESESESESDDSDGPVVVLDLEKGY